MAYLTLFTLPKPFTDPHIQLIQNNALASWKRLGHDVEVLLLGDDPGVAEAAEKYAATHVSGGPVNEYGTPLLNWAFEQAAARGTGELVCYVNTDIVLLKDFLSSLRRLSGLRVLAIGQRWDCDVEEPLDFDSGDAAVLAWARSHGRLDKRRGSDYFAYPRETDFGMPAFAVGRPGWDNWLIGRALAMNLQVVDMTPSVMAIHQNHDYRHVAAATGSDWEGPEADLNRRLAGSLDRYAHTPANATHVLTPQGLRAARSPAHLRARTAAYVSLNPKAAPLRPLVKLAERVYAAGS